MMTDALDRFGTRLEKRYTKSEVFELMNTCGLENITFGKSAPFWLAVGFKKQIESNGYTQTQSYKAAFNS